jgi:3D (Asp-Asp-Asp) domain-containing protein
MKAFLSRSIVVFSVLLVGLIVFSAKPSNADTPLQSSRDSKIGPKFESDETLAPASSVPAEKPLVPATSYVATAYSLRGRTASGRMVSRGLIAADPRVLPLGSRVKLEVAGYHGEYLVADTGGMIKGKRIDIWTPSSREAMRFGRRRVKLTVLSYGTRRTR